MDDNNVNPVSSDQEEAAKKYQEILDKYASDLESNTIPPEEVEDAINPSRAPEPSISVTSPLAPASDLVEPPPPAPVAPEPYLPHQTVPQFTPPTPAFTPQPTIISTPASSSSGIFKYLFYLSLIIFLSVLGAFIYTAYKMNNLSIYSLFSTPTPTSIPLPIATPTSDYSNMCDLNGKKYAVGETFKAFDGCNTCTCGTSFVIDCTQLACNSTPSSSASVSAIPKDWKTVTFSQYGFTFKIPNKWGIIINMLTGKFISIATNKTFSEGYNLVQIKKNASSNNLIQIDLTRQSDPYITKTGTEPEFDQIISSFKFTK